MQPTDLSSRVIPATDYRRERWRNQLGWTREILCLGDADAWALRLSIAEIEQDAVFSAFPGIDRELVLLHGNGMRLQFGDAGCDRSAGGSAGAGAGAGAGIGTPTPTATATPIATGGDTGGKTIAAATMRAVALGVAAMMLEAMVASVLLAAIIAAGHCCRRTSASDSQAKKGYMRRCSTGRPRISI